MMVRLIPISLSFSRNALVGFGMRVELIEYSVAASRFCRVGGE
jgi:hypothetical protein